MWPECSMSQPNLRLFFILLTLTPTLTSSWSLFGYNDEVRFFVMLLEL